LASDLVADNLTDSPNGVVFSSPRKKGSPLVGSSLDHAVKRLCERHLGWTGEKRFRPHDLRRTGATRMAELGVDPFAISRVLNHKLRGVTAVYVRSSFDARKREALELWDRHLASLVRSS
jgi:integrase